MTLITVTVTVKVFSLDAAPAMLREVEDLIHRETESGTIEKEDGDYASWEVKRQVVESLKLKGEGAF